MSKTNTTTVVISATPFAAVDAISPVPISLLLQPASTHHASEIRLRACLSAGQRSASV